MGDVIEEVVKAIREGKEIALVTPVAQSGSLPMGREARMAVRADRSIVGTVGGGRMEADVCEAALHAIGSGRSLPIAFSLTARDALEEGLLCGGEASFYIEVIDAKTPIHAFLEMQKLSERRISGVEAVLLEDGGVQRLIVCEDGATAGHLECGLDPLIVDLAPEAMAEDCSEIRTLNSGLGNREVFINALLPRPTVYIFGGGHIGLALAQIAPMAGFRVVVTDDRLDFVSEARFPMVDQVRLCAFAQAFAALDIDELSYVVVVTRGHQWDREVVEQALQTSPAYIGMIGSKRKIGLTWEALRERGFSQVELDAVHAPIGLDIGGDTPGEIAVSILAELIQIRRRGPGPKGKHGFSRREKPSQFQAYKS